MEQVLLFATLISPIILALVELVKNTVKMPRNYVPLVAVIVGLLVGFAAQPFTELDLVLRLWAGGLAGLSATGLFEFVNKRTGYTK
jgi:uncharacterized membrane protein AbrB (regulator of aidB expression)